MRPSKQALILCSGQVVFWNRVYFSFTRTLYLIGTWFHPDVAGVRLGSSSVNQKIPCDLLLCSENATHVRVCSPAREFLHHLCAHHWQRLQAEQPDLAVCYEPLPLSPSTAYPTPIVLIVTPVAARSPWIHSLLNSLSTPFWG
jgi:hypothetical protein